MAKLTTCADFYGLSECRDLLFHVHERRFTLPMIEDALESLGLRFLGFDMTGNLIALRQFREIHPDRGALASLGLWHQFELRHPDTFVGMYQFWVHKEA